ncbi:MAG: hypothetical protein MUF07_03770 [Steroidobacteraceae bacterium]|nr:hypothetical protein [Steroidobacteraceae bacterium]
MDQNSRPTQRDAHLDAARRFGERAKACAQWRRSGLRIELLRPGTALPGPGEVRQSPGTATRDSRSHA